jgi:hypothetical protein
MGYHPETLAFSFPPYPRGGMSLKNRPQAPSLGRALYAIKPWIGFDVWHIDPERRSEGQRTDDSCGWFDRRPGEYADAVKYLISDQSFMHDVDLTLKRRKETLAPFYEGISERPLSYPRMSPADTLSVVLMVATELELRRWWNGQNGKEGVALRPVARLYTRKRGLPVLLEAISLALHPLDNLSSIEDGEAMVRLIAGALHRKFKPWWRHPRWHVHHWKINFDLPRNLKRMFQACGTCRKPLGFGYCPSDPGDGTHHHGECIGHGFASATKDAA